MQTLRNKLFFYGTTAMVGLVSLGLHRVMMEQYIDEKGLLIAGNMPAILLWVLGIVFVLLMCFKADTLGGEGSYEDDFPRDIFSGGLLIAAGLMLALAVPGMERTAPGGGQAGFAAAAMDMAGSLLPWLAAASMVVLGVCRLLGRRPWAILGGLICLFYMMMLVRNYRLWSADPQVQDYAYQLLAGVLLMLCAFHRTCCDAGVIQRKKLILTGLMAAGCCLAALSMPFQQNFYLASALWGFGCICAPSVLPMDPEENEE